MTKFLHGKTRRLVAVLESPPPLLPEDPSSGKALARIAEAHPAFFGLLDFAGPDPVEIAREIGLIYPWDPEDEADLEGIELSPAEWFEPTLGLTTVHAARTAIQTDPGSVAAAIYDPTLRVCDILADLDTLTETLAAARNQETRFRLVWLT
jgi:hypothetical protein